MDDSFIIKENGGTFVIKEDTCMDHNLLYDIIGESSTEKLYLDDCFVRLFGGRSNGVEISIEYFKKAKYKGKDFLYDLEWFQIEEDFPDWVPCRLKYQLLIEVNSEKSDRYCHPYGKNFRSETILKINHEVCISEDDDMWFDTGCFILENKDEISKYFRFELEVPNYIVDFWIY